MTRPVAAGGFHFVVLFVTRKEPIPTGDSFENSARCRIAFGSTNDRNTRARGHPFQPLHGCQYLPCQNVSGAETTVASLFKMRVISGNTSLHHALLVFSIVIFRVFRKCRQIHVLHEYARQFQGTPFCFFFQINAIPLRAFLCLLRVRMLRCYQP